MYHFFMIYIIKTSKNIWQIIVILLYLVRLTKYNNIKSLIGHWIILHVFIINDYGQQINLIYKEKKNLCLKI